MSCVPRLNELVFPKINATWYDIYLPHARKGNMFRLQYPLLHSVCKIYTPSQSLVEESRFFEPPRETENLFQKWRVGDIRDKIYRFRLQRGKLPLVRVIKGSKQSGLEKSRLHCRYFHWENYNLRSGAPYIFCLIAG